MDENTLVGFCERCEHWTTFDKKSDWVCEKCGKPFSKRVGYQITTKRTFNEQTKRKKIVRK